MPRRQLRATALVSLLLVLAAVLAFADSPHFISASAKLTSSGDLVASWKEAGLGDNVQTTYTVTADATATYGCINKGGNHPQASNKETVSGPVSASGTFSSSKNGSINASLTLEPPPPGDFTCPGNQVLELGQVSYTDVTLRDTTNNISESLGGPFSATINNF